MKELLFDFFCTKKLSGAPKAHQGSDKPHSSARANKNTYRSPT